MQLYTRKEKKTQFTYVLELIAYDAFFLTVFNKVQDEEEEKKKKSDVLSGCRNRSLFEICH